MVPPSWTCPVCGGSAFEDLYRVPEGRSEQGVDGTAFRPSADLYGRPVGAVVRCGRCGHGSLREPPSEAAVSAAYAEAEDPVSIREEPGQVETARRALERIERSVRPGRVLDAGCWTGSFLVAARDRGWDPVGLEPSTWASDRARERGIEVHTAELSSHPFEPGSFRLVVMGDVIEHLAEPREALRAVRALLEPDGALYLTTPDAGSRVGRLLGRRWWSVLPMHLQYFTRGSLRRLLDAEGLRVRWMATNPKVFTARYYAERLAGYSPGLARGVAGGLTRAGLAGRMVAPDFRDRVEALAIRANDADH